MQTDKDLFQESIVSNQLYVYNIKELTSSHYLDENREVERESLVENIVPPIGNISKELCT